MSKLKKRIEKIKREYAEATPDGKRKIVLSHIITTLIFLTIILSLAILMAPIDWKGPISIVFMVFCVFLHTSASVSNRLSRNAKSNLSQSDSHSQHDNL